MAFSVYCGISIMHALVHKRVQKAEARYKLSQELLLFHMKVSLSFHVTFFSFSKLLHKCVLLFRYLILMYEIV